VSHSLGPLDFGNILGWGGIATGKIYAMPLAITAPLPPGVSVTDSLWDSVPGMILAPLTNPNANFIRLPFLEHRLDLYKFYDPPK
jgi:hypothetical protein